MSQISFEEVLTSLPSWSPEEIAKLRAVLNDKDCVTHDTKASSPSLREKARVASLRDFSAQRRWLAEHRDEYAGQWVALKGSQLICHSVNAQEVFAAAEAAGMLDTLVVLVEPRREQPFINLG